jgi:hypothetical protein
MVGLVELQIVLREQLLVAVVLDEVLLVEQQEPEHVVK